MKFNRLTAFTLSSALLTTSIGLSLIQPSESLANELNRSDSSVLLAQKKPQMIRFVTLEPGHPTTGNARMVMENGKRYLEFDNQFTTGEGPDVQVILYRSTEVPMKLESNKKDYMVLAKLKSFKGAQRYEIPATVNLDQYKSVGIWCKKFDVTFAYASF